VLHVRQRVRRRERAVDASSTSRWSTEFSDLFWWGFALPIPPLLALARTILILVNWQSLK
jgi:hypothetical protein